MKHSSDRITSIRNGGIASLRTIHLNVPNGAHFRKLYIILEVLQKQGFIRGFTLCTVNPITMAGKANATSKYGIRKNVVRTLREQSKLAIHLKYDSVGKSVIRTLTSVSKPGRDHYISARALWQPQTSTGFYIISTPYGVITDSEARVYNVGGKVLFSLT